jgi:hypothetical protein
MERFIKGNLFYCAMGINRVVGGTLLIASLASVVSGCKEPEGLISRTEKEFKLPERSGEVSFLDTIGYSDPPTAVESTTPYSDSDNSTSNEPDNSTPPEELPSDLDDGIDFPTDYGSLLNMVQDVVSDGVAKYPYLATDRPNCSIVSGDWAFKLRDYSAEKILAASKYIRYEGLYQISRVHYFAIVPTDTESIIVDGTYRQFLVGGDENPDNEALRAALPDIYVGNLEGLHELFRANKALLAPHVRDNIMEVEGTNEVTDGHVRKLVDAVYGEVESRMS